jgi:uncharacterized protein YgbK (DUF1537 family)
MRHSEENSMRRPLMAFYGDDFTGSTENLAQFCRHGLSGRLFFSSGNHNAITSMAAELDIVGLAGTARGLVPEAITAEVEPALAVLAAISPRLMQFKVCSTFDSSPAMGSIGHVLDLARQHWPGCALPVLPATPAFGRFTAFSHLFMCWGGEICRLDQNPTVSRHPSTPMLEADLRRHLAAQTAIPSAAVTLLDYREADGGWRKLINAIEEERFVVLDATDRVELQHAADLLLRLSERRVTLAVAAQGLADVLGEHWAKAQKERLVLPTTFAAVDKLLVLSGSCSPQTRAQLAHFEAHGGVILGLSPAEAIDDPVRTASRLLSQMTDAFDRGHSVAISSILGGGLDADVSAGHLSLALGGVFANLVRELREVGGIQRVVFSGGDTSSHAMRLINAEALDVVAFDEQQGGHLCRLISTASAVDGLEVVLKGGQIGREDFFSRVQRGI